MVRDREPIAVCQGARTRGRDDTEAQLGDLVRRGGVDASIAVSVRADTLCLVHRLGLHAFHRILSRRPTVYSPLLTMLTRDLRGPTYGGARVHLQKVVGHTSTTFADRGNGERKARMS